MGNMNGWDAGAWMNARSCLCIHPPAGFLQTPPVKLSPRKRLKGVRQPAWLFWPALFLLQRKHQARAAGRSQYLQLPVLTPKAPAPDWNT